MKEKLAMKSLCLLIGRALPVALFGLVAFAGVRPAVAQPAGPADFTQFGFPTVAASVQFTPGQAATLTAGTQQVVLPAHFVSKPVKFELLPGAPSVFRSRLESDDQGRPIVAVWAFRVTDMASGQRIES